MGIKYHQAKTAAKNGSKMLIALLVLNTAYSLIRFIIFKTVYDDSVPTNYISLESIITNLIFVPFVLTLTFGMLFLSIYYFKQVKMGLIAPALLIIEVGIKIVHICYQFLTFASIFDPVQMERLTEIFDLVTSLLFILAFVLFNIFQQLLKRRTAIGFGQGFLPYTFGFFGLVYPIMNLLNLLSITFASLPISVQAILHMLSYVAAILEIIMFFDLLRRFDHLKPLPEDMNDTNIIIKKEVEEAIDSK